VLDWGPINPAWLTPTCSVDRVSRDGRHLGTHVHRGLGGWQFIVNREAFHERQPADVGQRNSPIL
jgi:hypothetical protein